VTATYDANIVGAIEALVDLMSGNSFAMTREPYAPNYRGLVDAIIDLKEGFPVFVAPEVGFFATAGATINQGQAVYLDHSTGFAYPAIANTTEDQAHVAGFANQTQTSGNQIQILVAGILPTSGLSTGNHYYLSASTAGAITTTPPSHLCGTGCNSD
jgi:Uncharacterized conserved protein (DUF2190)